MDTHVQKKVEDFFTEYPQRIYPKDQIIIFAGELPEKVYFIESGKVAQYDISYKGDEIVVNVYKSPAFFPMTCAISRAESKFFYKTEVKSIVRIAPPDEVVMFLKNNPDVTFNLLSRVYSGIEGILARTVRLMAGSARDRLMYELLIEYRRFGKKVSDGTYRLDVYESDLAAHSGLARETVSRELKHLKDKNVIEVFHGYIIIKDIERLKVMLGQTS